MIEEPPVLTVKRAFARPRSEQLEAIASATTGWVIDAQQGRAGLGPEIKPVLAEAARCHGTIVTCWCGPNDNLAIFGALAVARAGDVIVAATEGFRHSGICGDLLAGMMRNKGIAGFVTDGHVRDLADLRGVGLPVFAAGINPDSCVKSGPGTVGLPVVIGGRTVCSGDLLLADEDGVATVPLATADDVLERLAAVREAEASLLARVRSGLQLPESIEALMASERVRHID
ncbi:RraA family protein [Geminicoccaceae bacterium 1502E]|nr:RraA family protein [Geminicoccaceae bacterium 1502E]